MAGGAIAPFSAIPQTANTTFPTIYTASSRSEEGLGVAASIAADSTWGLRYQLPPTLPTGTAKMLVRLICNASSGNAKLNLKWNMAGTGENPTSVSLNAEGVSTITPAAASQYLETKITLDASTIAAAKVLVCEAVFETSSWSLAVVSCWQLFVIWE